MITIPNTKVKAVFIEKPDSGYAPIFYKPGEGLGPMLSVNAGNSIDLYVGGGGINGGFNYALKGIQNTAEYQERHQKLLDQVRNGGTESEVYPDDDPTAFSLVCDRPVTQTAMYHDGVCFVDVFGKNIRPNDNGNNMGMLYVAPPYGGNYAGEADFLKAVTQTAGNIVSAVGEYNSIAGHHHMPEARVLRLCLYSSGIYNTRKVAWDKIALAIFEGIKDELEKADGGLAYVEFPFGNPLFYSVKTLLED